MKRDMELIRQILFNVENKIDNVVIENLEVSDYDKEEIAYHCALLYEAGLISYYEGEYADGEICDFIIGRLTWDGHELLDKIREDTVWNRTKDIITTKGLPMIFDVVKEVASSIIVTLTQKATMGL